MKYLFLIVLFFPFIVTAQSQGPADLYGEGVRAYYAGDYETAIKKYTDALALKPNTEGYLFDRARAYLKMKSDQLAISDFRMVVSLDSNYSDAWYELGMMDMNRRQYDSAFILFNYALRINKNDVRSLHKVGLLYYYRRENGKAIDTYNKILQLEPSDDQAYYKRGLAEFNEEDFVEAIKDFSETYKIDPENTTALEQRAISFMRLNDLENACKDWYILLRKGNPRAKESISKYCAKDK